MRLKLEKEGAGRRVMGSNRLIKKGKLSQRFRNGQLLDRLDTCGLKVKRIRKRGVDGWVKNLETWKRKPEGEI